MWELCNTSYRVGKACQFCLLNQHQHPCCWFQVRINWLKGRIRPTSYVGGLAERGGEGWWSHMHSWNRAWMRYGGADIIFSKLAKHIKQISPFQNVQSFITILTLQSKVTQLWDWNKIVHRMMHRILLNLCVCVSESRSQWWPCLAAKHEAQISYWISCVHKQSTTRAKVAVKIPGPACVLTFAPALCQRATTHWVKT
jgi:hypothetical protein